MALVLDPTLAAAQDAQFRRPLAEIISGAFVPDVPFDGQLLTGGATAESRPNMISLSSGRLAIAMKYSVGGRYVYTDEERLEFSFVAIPNSISFDVEEMVLCELGSGNVGVVFLESSVSTWRLSSRVISPTGELVSSLVTIANYAKSSYWIGKPATVRLPAGGYIFVYGKEDAGTYTIQKRTSSDFLSWSAESALSIGGLDSSKCRDNPSLLVDTHDDLFLFFDYLDEVSGNQERTNVYYSVSSDGGSTWSTAVAVTSYADFTATGLHPAAVQLIADQIKMVYYEQRGALHADVNTAGWTDNGSKVNAVSFDPVTRKIYAICGALEGVVEMDLDTWTVTNMWDDGSVPAFPAWLGGGGTLGHHERHLVVITDITNRHLYLLDAQANTITGYHFSDDAPHQIVTNVEGLVPGGHPGTPVIQKTWVDFASQRLWIYFAQGYIGVATNIVGYIDLSQTAPPYTFHQVVTHTFTPNAGYPQYDMWIDVAENYAVVSHNGDVFVYSLETGNVLYTFNYSLYPEFPYQGLHDVSYLNRNIYGTFFYFDLYGQGDYRGLCRINLDDSSISYSRPTWDTLDDYKLYAIEPISTGELLIVGFYCVTKFNPLDGTWVEYSNDTIPGFTPTGVADGFSGLAYDSLTGTVLTGSNGFYTWNGLIAFSIYGFIRQSHYIDGVKSGGSWSFGSEEAFTQGLYDYEATASKEPGTTALYSFWTRQEGMDLRVAWDKEQPAFNLSQYLISGKAVMIRRGIDGTPGRLEFTVSHGQLFDPHNSFSLLSPYLKKFRKITVRFGEKIGGSEYWQNAGVFAVTENHISYERGVYPVMSVTAEDKRSLWEGVEVIATEHYETYPEAIIGDVLVTWAGELLGSIDLPDFDGRYVIWRQWIDTDVKRIIDDIANRFGYFVRVTVDDEVSARKISNVNPVDHAYANTTRIQNFSPDDSFSDWTNRVVVVGESRDFIDVLMNEEPIQVLSGTVGWFGHKKTVRVYYSEDRTKRCRNPRLEIIESVKNFNFRLGGGGESITDSDGVEFLWVEVTIDMPNLVPEAAGLVAAITALGIACGSSIFVSGYCFAALCILLGALFYIVSSFALYQYQLHARPMGKERQSIQAEANDVALQAQIGRVVTKKLEDSLCITVGQCLEVANYELMIAQLQRNRVTLKKIAHLQDEEGDTITFPHPYTGATIKIFVTDLTRTYTKPAPGSESGGIFDQIEGWVL
jgi:hypothetical protein